MRSNAYDALDRSGRPGTRATRLPLCKGHIKRITQSKRPAASGRQRPEVSGCATHVYTRLAYVRRRRTSDTRLEFCNFTEIAVSDANNDQSALKINSRTREIFQRECRL